MGKAERAALNGAGLENIDISVIHANTKDYQDISPSENDELGA